MGASADEIERQIKETREQIDEDLGVLEHRALSSALRYGKIAAVIVGVVAVAGVGVLIYRRVHRPTRPDQLRSLLIEAFKDLPGSLHDLPDEISARLKKPLPSIKVAVNADEPEESSTLERIVRRVAPALVGTASTAVIKRFTQSPNPEDARPRTNVPAYD
jgi:hypothetical protein